MKATVIYLLMMTKILIGGMISASSALASEVPHPGVDTHTTLVINQRVLLHRQAIDLRTADNMSKSKRFAPAGLNSLTSPKLSPGFKESARAQFTCTLSDNTDLLFVI